MFRIYTKEKKSKEVFNINLTQAEVNTLMKGDLFLDHQDLNPEDYIIVERDQPFEHPTYRGETYTIEEATRDELVAEGIEVILNDGEVIENKKIKVIERPSKWHKWSGIEWTVNLKEVKKTSRTKFQKIRDDLLHEPLKMTLKPYGENKKIEVLFQVKEKDLAKFGRIKGILFTLNKLGVDKNDIEGSKKILENLGIDNKLTEIIIQFLKTGALPWLLADNTTKMFEFEKLEMVEVVFGIREQQIFAKFMLLDEQLNQANSIEEIEAINWE
ncbi:MAG: hypothetical protein KGV57_01180 [Fusobacterium sp.]|nr:hypothetical protein [Fusobacterium sp.]